MSSCCSYYHIALSLRPSPLLTTPLLAVHMTQPQCIGAHSALARLVDLPKADNVHTHITYPPLFPTPLPHFHDTKCISCAALHFRVHPPPFNAHPNPPDLAACRVSIAALIKINIFCTKPNRDQEQVPWPMALVLGPHTLCQGSV